MHDLRNNLPLLYDFYIVAKANSFSKAAEENYVSQSNLSRNVKKLEEILGLELISRNNRGINLTTDGTKLYKQLDEMFINFSKYNDIEKENLNGTITIGTTRNIADNILSDYLITFHKQYPNIKIKIVIDNASNLNEYLMNHKIDILIDYLPHINFSEKLDITVKTIGQFKTCFACSKRTYENGLNKITSLTELLNYNLVIPGSSRRRQLLDEIFQKNQIMVNPVMEMPDSKLMIKLVEKGDFIGYFIEDELKESTLVKLNIKESLPVNTIGIIYPKNTINEISKKFIKIVLDNC